MSNKKLDTSNISSELRAGSVFFEKGKHRTKDRSNERTEGRTINRTENRSVQLPIKRMTKRYSFEFYVDQVQKIKKIKLDAELRGERIMMSDIVRDALDQYLENF